jgi:hypothetical protein
VRAQTIHVLDFVTQKNVASIDHDSKVRLLVPCPTHRAPALPGTVGPAAAGMVR